MTLLTDHGTKTIQDFVDLYRGGRLNLSPAFQRQSVWTARPRQLLIESLLDRIPVPSIYLYRSSSRGGIPVYDVIDGKQRLETILLFLGRGPLVRSDPELLVRRAFQVEDPLEWWGWRDLNNQVRNQLLTTDLPTIEVEGELSEIIELFVRINSTGARLTGQERRHAHYYTSPILRLAQQSAERFQPWLNRHSVITPSQIQRMKHVELITELLLGIGTGVHLNKKTKIDEIIRGGGLSAEDLKGASNALRRAFSLIEAVLPDLKTTRFRQLADFYSLTLLLHHYWENGRAISAHDSGRNALAGALLRDFGRGVDEVAEQIRRGRGATAVQEPFRDYLMTVREGTDSAAQRTRRETLLSALLDGIFDVKDSVRIYSAVQRRVLWHGSVAPRVCDWCGKEIERWEDMSVDHVRPYSRGGATTLDNAALLHSRCNKQKGAA